MNSKNLVEKDIAFVNVEISNALERSKEFRENGRFIIPVQIDDSPLLGKLDDIQAIDVTDKKNIEALIQIIKDDFAQRRSK